MSSAYFLGSDLFWTGLKWLMVLAVWGALSFGIYHEDRRIRRSRPIGNEDVAAAFRMLHQRNLQVWILISLLVMVGAEGDIRRNFTAAPAPAESMPVIQTPVVTAAPAHEEKSSAISSPLPFSDITEFNEIDSKQQVYLDMLKQRFEDWLVTYYYLEKCSAVDAHDFDLITNSLSREVEKAHGDTNILANITVAARGSYNELYRDIPCDAPHLSASKATYDANMQQLRGVNGAQIGSQSQSSPNTKTAVPH